MGVSDVGNQLAFTYGPDGKPNTPVTHVGAVHVLVRTSPGPHRVEFIGEENPSPLGATGDGVFTGSFSTTRPAAVAFDGEDPLPPTFFIDHASTTERLLLRLIESPGQSERLNAIRTPRGLNLRQPRL